MENEPVYPHGSIRTIEDEIYVILIWALPSIEVIINDFFEKWRNPPVLELNRKRAEFGQTINNVNNYNGDIMADWCKQCSDEMFGEEHPFYQTYDKPAPPGRAYMILCEGCGIITVNQQGECNDPSCTLHNSSTGYPNENVVIPEGVGPILSAMGYNEENILP